MVHEIRKIDFEPCDSINSAQVRELALIRLLRPKYNVANTLSPTYSYFGFHDEVSDFQLTLRMSQVREDGETIVGGFRNRGLCARAFLSLARTGWARKRCVASVYDFPAALNSRTTRWRFPRDTRETVWGLVKGEAQTLVEESATLVEETTDPFLRQMFEADFLALAEFAELAKEMAELRQDRDAVVLSQEALQVSDRLRRVAGRSSERRD
jgi:hypothetical protein